MNLFHFKFAFEKGVDKRDQGSCRAKFMLVREWRRVSIYNSMVYSEVHARTSIAIALSSGTCMYVYRALNRPRYKKDTDLGIKKQKWFKIFFNFLWERTGCYWSKHHVHVPLNRPLNRPNKVIYVYECSMCMVHKLKWLKRTARTPTFIHRPLWKVSYCCSIGHNVC